MVSCSGQFISYTFDLNTQLFMFKSVEFILRSGAFTLHGEKKDGISTLYKVPALGSEVGEIHCSASAWPSEIRGPICIIDLNAHLARVIPEKLVRVCLKGC